MPTLTFTSSGTWTALATSVDCQCTGEGGKGCSGLTGGSGFAGGGGGGGEYAEETSLALTVSSNYSYTIGSGGSSTNTSFPGDAITVTAHHGTNGFGTTSGQNGGSGSTNTIHFSGGKGGNGNTLANPAGAGGGGAAGTGAIGGTGINGSNSVAGAAGGTGGATGGGNGGQGGDGNVLNVPGRTGVAPGGGGGGGSGRTGGTNGGAGAAGQIVIIYVSSISGTATLSGVGTLAAASQITSPTGAPGHNSPGPTWLRKFGFGRRHRLQPGLQIQTLQATAALTGTGTLTSFGSTPAPAVVNAWSNSYGQGTTFTTLSSALQSCVVPLTPSYSIGAGDGTPNAGNWLFTIASWTQDPQIIDVQVGVSDDIHSWWRQQPAAGPGGNSRTSVTYTPNTAGVVGNVYVAPNGEIAAINVVVLEVQGMGAWDVVTGTNANYAAAATSLSLALSAPPAATFFIAGVGGDNVASGQSFAPSGWNTVTTQTQTNGSNNLADNILSVAYKTDSSSSQSVSASASTAENMSGFLLGVEVAGASPIPANQNPNWPYTKFEAAFGAGFNTPNSQITTGSTSNPLNWTDLSTRLWSFDETTGIQYQLGQLQATNLQLELDNNDGYLSSLNVGSPYYSNAMNANMSFQGSISPWSAGDGGTIALSTAQTYASASGAISNYSMSLHGNGSTANPGAFSEQFAVTPSWGYSASAWFYSASSWASGVAVGINWYTSGNAYISTSTITTVSPLPAATWTQVTVTNQTSPSNAAYGQIIAEAAGTPSAGQIFYIAEAAMVPGSSIVLTGLVSPGTPIRMRFALGTLGGTTFNRWYVIQRNASEWNEQITPEFRRYCFVTGTDLWAAMSSVPPTSYRAEIAEDNPQSWWAMDDQPLNFGVLPTTLLNSATGNTNVMNIEVSPDGAQFQAIYNSVGAAAGNGHAPGNYFGATHLSIPPGVAIYQVGADAGWMFGDPQGTAPSLDTGNPVTSNPGSAAWQAGGQAGAAAKYGWYLITNDSTFPPLSGGITIEIWFNYQYYGSASGFETSEAIGGNFGYQLQQPYNSAFTIFEMATSSNPVAIFQLDTSGALNLITYNGSSGTSHSIYSTSDLRDNNWHMITATFTTTTWQVYLDGGANANVSGTAAGMTSAWTYLIVNGDYGANGGSVSTSFGHNGNASFSHLAVYPYILPYYRIMDHYWAAVTAFGQLPTPTSLAVAWSVTPVTVDSVTSGSYNPDGSDSGSYSTTNGVAMSARVAAIAPGGVTSGASSWGVSTAENVTTPIFYGTGTGSPFVSFTGVAPQFAIYTSATPGAETEASIATSGDGYSSGFGGSASGVGVAHISGGDGSSPTNTPSSIGDAVGQRIERLLRNGRTTSPQRSIDPAPLLVQAPGNQGGGVQTASAVQEIQQSDSGLLFIDNLGNLVYWQRPHLAAQYSTPVWAIGPTTTAGRIPYYKQIKWIADPQRIWNSITVAPFSPSGSELPLVVPQNNATVLASQNKYGAQPLQVISWLQSQTEMQNQANWLFTNFGVPQRRAQSVKIDAAPYPAAWGLVAGINVGDIVQIEDWIIGGGGNVYTYRVTEINRRISFGSHNDEVIAEVELTCDFEPTSYWS